MTERQNPGKHEFILNLALSNSPSSQHVSHKQIAEMLNISRTTVSNVLSGRADLPYSEETRQRVLAAAGEVGYQPHRASVALRKGKSNLIGVIYFGGRSGRLSTSLLLPQAINRYGYDYLVIDFHCLAHEGVKRMVSEMIQSRVEGVIISHMQGAFRKEHLDMLRQTRIPILTIYGSDRLRLPLFCDNPADVFEALTRHLLSVGHRDLLLVVVDNGSRTPRERIEGFSRALEGVGTVEITDAETYLGRQRQSRPRGSGEPRGTVVCLENSPSTLEPSFQFGLKLFAQENLPHALLASNDLAAHGYFHAAAAKGVRIPEDIAVTGFDNITQSAYPLFNLTTAQTDVEYACDRAVQAMVRYLKGEAPDIQGERFASQLILRGSCGRTVSGEEPVIVDVPLRQ